MQFNKVSLYKGLCLNITVVLAVLYNFSMFHGIDILPTACSSGRVTGNPATLNTFSTHFALTENPISKSGPWINGQTVGHDWAGWQSKYGSDVSRNYGFSSFSTSDDIPAPGVRLQLSGTAE
jgi:hypothetical protein